MPDIYRLVCWKVLSKYFFPDKEKEGIILKPDQQVTVSEGKMIVSQISLERAFFCGVRVFMPLKTSL